MSIQLAPFLHGLLLHLPDADAGTEGVGSGVEGGVGVVDVGAGGLGLESSPQLK